MRFRLLWSEFEEPALFRIPEEGYGSRLQTLRRPQRFAFNPTGSLSGLFYPQTSPVVRIEWGQRSADFRNRITMRLPTQHSRRTPLRFNITPLIDVVFLLIIFFLVASHFVRSEQAEPVDLPLAAKSTQDLENSLHRVTVTIRRDGAMMIAGKPQSREAVFLRVKDLRAASSDSDVRPEVRIRADRSGTFGPIRRLVEHCAAQNVRSIQFAVDDLAE